MNTDARRCGDAKGKCVMQWMSFALTVEQMRAKTKTVTRRLGWKNLKPGTLLHAAERTRGLKRHERKLVSLGLIRVVSVRREPLHAITAEDVAKEGFPDKSPEWFVEMFAAANDYNHPHDVEVTRIEFEFLPLGHAQTLLETMPFIDDTEIHEAMTNLVRY